MVMSTEKVHRFGLLVVFLLSVCSSSLFSQITSVGTFEGSSPSYWSKGNEPAGATLSWATDQSRSLGHSLKICLLYTSPSPRD